MDWSRVPLSAFFRGPVLHTPEGLVFLAGSCSSLVFAVLSWLTPEAVFIPETRIAVTIALFALWPVCLLTIYVRICAPEFRPRAVTTLFVFAAAVVPFWLAYRGSAV